MITIEQTILNQSKAVRTFVLPEVLETATSIAPDYDSITIYDTQIIKWLSPIVDLSGYHVYPVNGITEGLNWWMAKESRGIYMDDGDYQWIKETGSEIKYTSCPSAIDGNYCLSGDIVDLAYVGSAPIKRIEHNADILFYSLSKPFGLRNIRTGWMFTKKPDMRLEALIHSAKYYNYFAHAIAEAVINKFDIDYIYQEVNQYQKIICKKHDLIPSDSVWLGTTIHPLYDKFK
jgi:hypothetical protein